MKLGDVIGFYNWTEYFKAPSNANVSREGPIVGADRVAILDHLSVVDITTKNKMMRIGKKLPGGAKRFFKARQGSGYSSIWMNGKIVLRSGERAIGELDTPTADDEIYMNAQGLIYETR